MSKKLHLSIVAACLLASGCAAVPHAPQGEPSTEATAASRRYHDTLSLGGRISVQYQNDGKDESLHGSFEWEQSPERTVVTLRSPLGQTLAVINVAPEQATMMQAGKPPRSARDVDRLAADVLGWPLPVSGLHRWLQGFGKTRGTPFIAHPQGAGDFTTDDGWQLRYATWQEGSEPHPRRIDLKRSTAAAGDVAIRIAIDNWRTD